MLLRRGDQGPQVTEWQVALATLGYFDPREYWPSYGPRTEAATKAFQVDMGLTADGIVGPRTRAAAVARLAEGDGNTLNDDQKQAAQMSVEELASRAGIPPAVLVAIRHVESRGNPSAIRFEPHLFHRKRPDLADRVPYTRSKRGYSLVRSETNRSALERAMRLDPRVAIESASFGRYQVLGGYLIEAYGGDPERAYVAFKGSPSEASDLMVAAWFRDNPRAIEAANLNPPDFKKLAKCYNGPNYHVHKYDEQLESAWRKAQDEEVTV